VTLLERETSVTPVVTPVERETSVTPGGDAAGARDFSDAGVTPLEREASVEQ
jgi:hypothetical protein